MKLKTMGPKRWREMAARLRQMDRAELRDRTCQEFGKRQDALLSQLGFDFARHSLAAAATSHGTFFFTRESVETILTLIRQRLPRHAERIVLQAENICAHRFDLLGYKGIDYGNSMDWHLDAVHGIRSPKKPFYRIPYLSFADVGDSKITWELNRHQHFVTLAKAFRLTGDPRFVDEILGQWRHWSAENPYPIGINWASSLEVAFRAVSWLWTCQLLQSATPLDLRQEWLSGFALHGRHIERYLSTYFSPNTHVLGEAFALFFLGVMCPELAAAQRWKDLGWKIILQESERQVRPDGFHFEQSTYYHVYALDFFLHAAVLASLNNVPTPASFEQTIEKMLATLRLLSRGGSPPRFGDDDGGRLFDPLRNRSEHMIDPLSTGAVLFQRTDFKAVAGELREEMLWLLGSEGVRQWDALEAAAPTRESLAKQDAGIYILPSKNSPAELVAFTGPRKIQSEGHRHADALSLCLSSRGDSLLIDPGTFEYVGPTDDRSLFRGTAMHNTLRIDGVDQSQPSGPFSWQRLAQSTVEKWIQGNSFDYLAASHDGYRRLTDPVIHRRWIVSLRNGAYLIRDIAEGKAKHRLEIPWHLGQSLQLVEHGLYRVKGASHGLAILSPQGHTWAEEVCKDSCSPVYGQKAPMTTLRFTADAALPTEFAVLLVTLREAHRLPGTLAKIGGGEKNSRVTGYKFTSVRESSSYIFGPSGESWSIDNLTSDAELVCWTQVQENSEPQDSEQRLILCNGSFAALEGGLEIRCRETVAWAEVTLKSGDRSTHSSNPAAVMEDAVDASPSDAAMPTTE
jgi:hypothetical protein